MACSMALKIFFEGIRQCRSEETVSAPGKYLQYQLDRTDTVFDAGSRLLPRQFQLLVVENVSESHLRKAVWLFPTTCC